MIAPSEFQRYLQSVLDTSREDAKREVSDRYIPTLAELPLRVQTLALSEADSQEQQKRPEQFAVLEGLRKYASEHVLLLGKPGSGKSTSLRRLLWEEAGRCLEAIEQGNSEIPPIPILIELRGLSGLVLAAIQEKLGWWLDLDEKTLKALLRDRQLFVFLDGLNELPNEQAWKAVDVFRQVCAELKVPLIITTRELGSGLVQGNVKKLEMLPLTEPQMREFVYKQLPETGEELWRQIQGKLRELAETPLLLKLLCDVFEQNGQIPKSRGDLFRKEFARRYEEFKPERYRNISEDSRRFAFDLLSYLAFTMVQGEPHTDPCQPSASWITIPKTQAEKILATFLAGDRTSTLEDRTKAKEWLEDLVEWHLLQVASDQTHIEFHHQMFQEYYAAECLAPQLEKLSDHELQYYYLNYLKWTEPLAMSMSFVESERLAVRMVELALKVDLYLGSRLAGEVKQLLRNQTVKLIAKEPVCKKLKIRMLGKTQSDAAVSLLISLLKDESSSVRFDAVHALGQIGGEAAIVGLTKALNDNDNDYFVRVCVIDALTQIGVKSSILPALFKALEDSKIGEITFFTILAKVDLGNDFKDNLKILNDLIEHSEYDICLKAACTLIQINSKESTQVLLKALKNPDFDVQFSAAIALGEMGFEIAVPVLQKAIETTDSLEIFRIAIHALAKIDSKQSTLAITKLFQELNRDKLKLVSTILLSMDIEEIAPELRKIIQERLTEFKTSIYQILNTEHISKSLLQATKDIRPDVVKSAAFLLRRIGNHEMLSTLWEQQTRFFQEDVTETIAAIQSRCGFYNYEIYQQAQEAKNLGFEDDFIRNFYENLDKVIYQIQENPELRQNDKEDRLTIDIVNQLCILGYNASHDTKIGGHVDLTVRTSNFLWLGEAKISNRDNNYLWQGFQQLATRYSIGDSNQDNGGLLIYIFDEDASSIMKKWEEYLNTKNLPDYSSRPCKMRSLAFISTHRHERSGQAFHVRHIPVMLHFVPKDKSGRQSK